MIIAVLGVLALLIVPALHIPKSKATRIKCASNLKQIALSMKMYENDHNGLFPWQVQGIADQPQPAANYSETWRYFLAVSNELGATKILMCPADKRRLGNVAQSFTGLTNSLLLRDKRNLSVSYFIGPHGGTNAPYALMLGDRHISPAGSPGLYRSMPNQPVMVDTNTAAWAVPLDDEYHRFGGNLARCDGSVDQADTKRLRESLKGTRALYGTNANRFLFPQ